MKQTFISFFLLVITFSVHSQWSNDPSIADNLVDDSVNNIAVFTGLSIDDSSTQIVYWQSGNVYLQKLSKAGVVQYNPAVQISQTKEPANTNYNMVADAEGAVVAYYDDNQKSIHVQRVDLDGNKIWGDSGVIISGIGKPTAPFLIQDADFGGVFVAWNDAQKIKVLRIYYTGGHWAEPVIVSSINQEQLIAGIEEDAQGGAYVLFNQLQLNSTTDHDIYVQHIDALGNLLLGDTAERVVSAEGDQFAGTMALGARSKITFFNGINLGFLFAYRDYAGASDSSFILKAQNINSDGSFAWNADGINVSTLRIINGGNEFIYGNNFFWNEKRQGSNNQDVYGQYINNDGILGWGNTGINVTNKALNQVKPRAVYAAYAGHLFVTWQDEEGKLYAQTLNKYDGTALGKVMPVCTVTNSDPTNPAISFLPAGAVITWLDYRFNPVTNVYAEKIEDESVLSTKLLSFTALLQSKLIELAWQTADGLNIDYFTIEKSKDGKIFNAIQNVKAKGGSNSVANYRAQDDKPFTGISYYRLKQIDKDGTFTYSAIKTVTYIISFTASVIPNPVVNSNLKLNISSAESTDVLIQVTDVNGKQVLNQKITISEGLNTYAINIGLLPINMYYLEINNGQEKHTISFIKAK